MFDFYFPLSVYIQNPTPHGDDDDIEPFGISLPGNHAGLSPSEDERPAPPRPPACRHLEEEIDRDLSAEKVGHKITEYLENEGKEWWVLDFIVVREIQM